MTTPIEPLTLQQLRDNFDATLEADSGKPLALTPGSVLGAFRNAASFADLFVQQKAIEVGLFARLDTCEDTDLDSFVLQFSPPFDGRIPAVKATTSPLAPTTLTVAATSTYLLLGSVFGLVAAQGLRLTAGSKGAVTTITTVEPTTTLTTSVTNGAASLVVNSTAGMFPGGYLELSYGGYSTRAQIVSVASGTVVNITSLAPPVAFTFAGGGQTTVKLLKVLLVAALTLDGGTLLADLVAGSMVRATTLLEGARFYRNTATASPVLIPNGTQIAAPISGITYEVVADVTNPDYSSGAGGYYLPANKTSVYVKVRALTAGSDQNVLANSLTVLVSSVSGIDGVTNPYDIINGEAVESDDALKKRFRDFMTGRQSGTYAAVAAAIEGVSPSLQYNIVENVGNDGVTFQPGNFIVVAGDGNGRLTNDMYTALYTAIDEARPLTSTFVLRAPTVLTPVIVVVLRVLATADLSAAAIAAAVQTALYSIFNATPAGSTLYFNDIIEAAMSQAGVLDVVRATIDGDGYDTSTNSYVLVGSGPTSYVAGAFEFIRPPLVNIQVS